MAIDHTTAVRELEAIAERLQDRGDSDDPPLPDALVRGAVGGVLDPVAVHPTLILGQRGPIPEEQVFEIASSLSDRLPDLPPTNDQLLRRLREWQPERSKFDAAIRRLEHGNQ